MDACGARDYNLVVGKGSRCSTFTMSKIHFESISTLIPLEAELS